MWAGVGALAVALGIGAAVTSMSVAFADSARTSEWKGDCFPPVIGSGQRRLRAGQESPPGPDIGLAVTPGVAGDGGFGGNGFGAAGLGGAGGGVGSGGVGG